MGGTKWFEEWSGETTDQLLALEGTYRADSLVLAFEMALQMKDKLTEEEQVVLAIESLEREVNNGGYEQFFVNTPEFAPVIVDALECIGCGDVAALTQRAIEALGLNGGLTPDAVQSVIEKEDSAREDVLERCTEEYFSAAGDLAPPLMKFIRDNREKITLTAS